MASDRFWDDIRLKQEILKHIEDETFILTRHAAEEQKNDGIDMHDTLHVLKNGAHEKEKTCFENKFQAWRYAISSTLQIFGLNASAHFLSEAFF